MKISKDPTKGVDLERNPRSGLTQGKGVYKDRYKACSPFKVAMSSYALISEMCENGLIEAACGAWGCRDSPVFGDPARDTPRANEPSQPTVQGDECKGKENAVSSDCKRKICR